MKETSMSVHGGDALRMDGARTLLHDRFGTAHALPSIGAFLRLAFEGEERTTFGEFLLRLYRYHRRTAGEPIVRPIAPRGRATRPGGADAGSGGPERSDGPIHGGLGVAGGDAIGREDGRRAILGTKDRPWTTSWRTNSDILAGTRALQDVGAFLDLAFGEADRLRFEELLARLYRYYCDTGCSLVRTGAGERYELLPIPAEGDPREVENG
jgi:hypothetical protein